VNFFWLEEVCRFKTGIPGGLEVKGHGEMMDSRYRYRVLTIDYRIYVPTYLFIYLCIHSIYVCAFPVLYCLHFDLEV